MIPPPEQKAASEPLPEPREAGALAPVVRRSIGIRLTRGLWVLGCGSLWTWAALAALYSPLGRHWWGQLLAGIFFVGTTAAVAVFRRRPLRMTAALLTSVGVMAICFFAQTPEDLSSDVHPWSANHQHAITAEFSEEQEGTYITIHHVRSRVGDQVSFNSLIVDLQTLQTVWLGVQQFSSRQGIAHTFTSFGFENGEYIAISVEARRREGQTYSPLKGSFRHYPLIYVAGNEEEVIGKRAIAGEHPIHLYKIKATPGQAQEMFVAMLKRANSLAESPEFYNTFTNNCTTNIVNRFNEIAPTYISPYDLRIVLPGYSGAVAYEQGLLGDEHPYLEIHKRSEISSEAR